MYSHTVSSDQTTGTKAMLRAVFDHKFSGSDVRLGKLRTEMQTDRQKQTNKQRNKQTNKVTSSKIASRYTDYPAHLFVGAFAKLRRALSVCPSAWSNSAPTERIFMKFDV